MVHLEKKILKENKAECFEGVQRPHPQYRLCSQWQVSNLLWWWWVHFGETDIEQEDAAGPRHRLRAAIVLCDSFVSPLGVPEVPGGDLMGCRHQRKGCFSQLRSC